MLAVGIDYAEVVKLPETSINDLKALIYIATNQDKDLKAIEFNVVNGVLELPESILTGLENMKIKLSPKQATIYNAIKDIEAVLENDEYWILYQMFDEKLFSRWNRTKTVDVKELDIITKRLK